MGESLQSPSEEVLHGPVAGIASLLLFSFISPPFFHSLIFSPSANFVLIQLSLSGAQAAVPAVSASVLGPVPALVVPAGSEYCTVISL